MKPIIFYAKTTTFIIGPIILAIFLNRLIGGDRAYQFPVLIGLGFIFTCLGIWRIAKDYQKSLEIEKNDK